MKKKVFIPMPYYLPGENGGGPVQTIKNLINNTSVFIEYYISTLNHDLNSNEEYDVETDKWIERLNYKIIYTQHQNLDIIYKQIREINPDFIYLNGIFYNISIYIMHLVKLKKIDSRKIILAPRGELGKGALKQKEKKKKLYLLYSNILNLYKDVVFQASTELEKKDIQKIFTNKVKVAMDLPSLKSDYIKKEVNNSDYLQIVFLSRISPMKNLDFALKVLSNVKRNVKFDIYGPIEDKKYFDYCMKIKVPNNVKVNYFYPVKNEQVPKILIQYDCLFLPTRGENFGHVISESLLSGVPVIISDRTQWNNLDKFKVGHNISLNNIDEYVRVLENFERKVIDYSKFLEYIESVLNIKKSINDSLKLFK